MMTEQQFILYCERLKLAEPSRKYIERVRSSPPSRKVQSGGGNVTSRFPSRKMGVRYSIGKPPPRTLGDLLDGR
jgi:putative transposase